MTFTPADYVPLPGDIGLTQIHGRVGFLIRLGMWLNGDGFYNIQHAFVYLGGGELAEAEPGGARKRPLSEYAGNDVYWCSNLSKGLTAADRAAIVRVAKMKLGTPYSFLDYFALVAKRLGIPSKRLDRYIEATGHQQCSQYATYAWYAAGQPLYKTWTGWVTPLDLYNLNESRKLWVTARTLTTR